ncbi:hypothetical protein [Chamaesiphon sp.]|uniref:hypothetical protein n=1 Tax=Chamaesiphon sp. TaxID=2814140 RepID=UPI0035944800
MVNRIIVFIAWVLSSISFVIAIAGLATPGAGKFISLAFVGWALIFFPPLWKKTMKYDLSKNIGIRVFAFFLFPIISITMAAIGGYQPVSSTVSVSPSPINPEVPKSLPQNKTRQPATSSIAVLPTSNQLPSPLVVKIGEGCEQYMIDASSKDPNVTRNAFTAGEEYVTLCRSVDEFVAAGVKHPKAFKTADPEMLKNRLLNVCQDLPQYKKEPICVETLAAPKLTKLAHLSVDDSGSETPVPVTIDGVSVMVQGGYFVNVLETKVNLVKVELRGRDVDGNDLSYKVGWVDPKFVKVRSFKE